MEASEGWRRLDPKSVVAGQRGGYIVTTAISAVSLLFTAGALFADNPPGWVKLLIALAWVGVAVLLTWISWTVPRRQYLYTRYRVDELGLVLHRGRMFHSELGVARSRIQHTDVTQGPIQRLYGIATLSIYTAGTEDAQIAVSGISFDEARHLRAELTGQADDDVV